jgi:hypothetical protein
MNRQGLHRVLTQFSVEFRVHFGRLTEQDVHLILTGPRETLLTVLGHRYGYTPAQAKTAWNEFVLRAVDG